MKTLIAGGGIGGLALAAGLAREGVEVEVYERATGYAQLGAGITISVNAMASMDALGVGAAARAAGVILGDGDIRDSRGRRLTALPMRAMERAVGAPSIGIHRAALQQVLLDGAGAERVHFGCAAMGYRRVSGGVRLRLADGREVEGDLLVGADGLRSAIRAQLVGDGPPRYAGYTCWRGLADVHPAEMSLGSFFEAWGRAERFGGIPIADDCFFWYATADAPEGGQEPPGAALAALRARFGAWAEPVPTLLAATRPERVIRNDIYDRPPIDRWGEGRVTLLGDAAHPMTPNMGQGASQALEDAVVLTRAIAEARDRDPTAALRRYERARRTRTRLFVDASWAIGRFAQARGPLTARLRDAAMRLAPAAAVRAAMVVAGKPPRSVAR